MGGPASPQTQPGRHDGPAPVNWLVNTTSGALRSLTLVRTLVIGLVAGAGMVLSIPSSGSVPLEVTPAPSGDPAPAGTEGPIEPAPSESTGSGLVTIESDRQQADNVTGIVTATGNVKITYPDKGMVATSRQAQYFSREGRLVLSGDVDVIDAEGQSIHAERLTYQLDDERLLAEPPEGEQVRSKLRIQPIAPSTPPAPSPSDPAAP